MKHKTFADALILHGVELPADTVVINITEVKKHLASLPIPLHIETFRALPIFDNSFTEWSEDGDHYGLLFRRLYKFDNAFVFGIDFYSEIDGECTGFGLSNNQTFSVIFDLFGNYYKTILFNRHRDQIDEAEANGFIVNSLYAFYLIHQKAECELVTHSRPIRRRIKRKTGKEPSPYFLLRVYPGKVKKIGGGKYRGPSGQKKSRHIVRGFFRTTENHPIEQFNGTWWIPSHMRGSKDHGETVKGYTIVLPDDSLAPDEWYVMPRNKHEKDVYD